MAKVKGLYILSERAYRIIWGGEAEQRDVQDLVDIYAPPQTRETVQEKPELLADCEVILSGWGAPKLDEAFLAAAPNLKAVFYGAGSVGGFVTDAMWDRGVVLSSAWGANAVPVAEYTLSQIIWCLKKGWHYVRWLKEGGSWWERTETPGAYHRTVAVVSLGMIGLKVVKLLRPLDLEVVAVTTSAQKAADLGLKRVDLAQAFREADVVSLHSPVKPETSGMVTGEHFASMKPHAAFINTARGVIVREAEMIDVLRQRPDLHAVLDVTHPEPPVEGSPLYTLPNVTLTPHISGSMFRECNRNGRYMVEDLKRWLAGQPLRWQVDRQTAKRLA
jgi:phosphoglycerate dehydrogenase-like enzyme